MAPRRPLTAHTAQITTAAVELKTLTVTGKQVTLAVFRQLYDEPLYDPVTLEPNGVPWCRVNYHPDKCAEHPPHEHVVWQKNDELRRAKIEDPRQTKISASPMFGYDEDVAVCLLAGGLPDVTITYDGTSTRHRPAGVNLSVLVSLEADDGGDPALAKITIPYAAQQRFRSDYRAQASLEREHEALHPGRSGCEASKGVIVQRARQFADWQALRASRWEETQNLDQVFIAV